MSVTAVAWAFSQKLSPIDKLVLVAIADMVSDKTDVCWPSQSFLAKRCDICRQRVNEAVARLRDKGLLRVEARLRRDGSTTSCRYRLLGITTPHVVNKDTHEHPVAHDDTVPADTPAHAVVVDIAGVAHDDTPPEPSNEPRKSSVGSNEPTGVKPPKSDPIKEMWDRGVALLGEGSRSLIGKARKEYGDIGVLNAIARCEEEHPSKPADFFFGCLRSRAKKVWPDGIIPMHPGAGG